MFNRFDPIAKQQFILTTLSMIMVPVSVYFGSQCNSYADVMQEVAESVQILVSGFLAVLSVNIVVCCFMYTVYKNEIT